MVSVVARALALVIALIALPTVARAQCEVRGVASIDRLRVRIAGERLRTFAVTDLPVAVRPGNGGAYRDVRVLAPVTFAARTDAPIPWTVPRPSAVADGMLWLTPAVEVEDVREERSEPELLVRVQVDNGVWISRLHLPCDAIAVGHGEGGEHAPRWPMRGLRWQPLGSELWLASEPGDGATVRLDAPEGLPSPLVEVERRDGWIRLVAHFSSGAVLRGWAHAHHLVAAEERAAAPPSFRRTSEARRVPLCSHGTPSRTEYIGPASITTGALVLTAQGGAAWAEISEPGVYTVSWRPGSPWVRIIHIPGLSSDGRCPEVLDRAWVPREAVSLQGEGTAMGAVPSVVLGIE